MTPALALLVTATVALICAAVVYVARLHYADRANGRARVESKHTADLEELRDRVHNIEKTAREAHAMAAARATSRIRN